MIGRSMLAYIPVNLANIVVSFGTVAILTRLLAAEEFGRYATAMVTMHAVHMMVFTWLEAALSRYQARYERENDKANHLKTLYSLAAVTAIIAIVLLPLIIFMLPLSPPLKTVLGFAVASTCIQVFFNLGMEAHKASERIMRYSFSYTTQTLLSFSLGIILILVTPLREAAPFVGIMVATSLVILIDMFFMLPRMKGGRFQLKKTKLYAAYAIPLSLSLVLSYALNSADIYLIGGFMGDAAVGEYNAGYNLANRSIEIVFIWLSMAVTPLAIIAFEKSGLEVSESIMRNYGATLLWITLPAATGIALVAADAGFIMGESVRDNAVKVMPLIAFAGVLNGFINFYIQRAFVLSGATRSFAWVMVPPLVLNIGLNIWLIPIHGIMGAVYATVAAYGIGAILSFIIARRHYPLPLPIKAMAQISFACAIMCAAVISIPWPEAWPDVIRLFAKASIGVTVYGIVCWVMNAANCRDFVKSTLSRFASNDDAVAKVDLDGAICE
jgi:O-antigen/teichoic acid export membrane protein